MAKRHKGRPSTSRAVAVRRDGLASLTESGRGWTTVYDGEYDNGWWQKDMNHCRADTRRNWTVFACETLIAGDMGKMSPLLMRPTPTESGLILERAESAAFSPLFRKPNGYQTWPQFIQTWMFSKLRGNTYALKSRDARRVVQHLYVLDPDRVTPLVAPDGSVYYRLQADGLAGVPDLAREVVVPASEIIHDRMNCLFHPLVGLSPLYASALCASQGLNIQEMSSRFFRNNSRPTGILVAATEIKDELAKQYKARWEENYGGTSSGGTAVLGNGFKYEAITQNAVDSELSKQLGMTAEQVCSTYHVPGYKVGVGPTPTYQNAEVYDAIYYDACIQVHATDIEALFDSELGLYDAGYAFKFDLDDLLKMDSATQVDVLNKSVGGGWMAPNEARAKRNLRPKTGGDSPMMQQQQFSLEALAARDADKPFAKPAAPPAAAPAPPADAANDDDAGEQAAAKFLDVIRKGLDNAAA